MAKDERTTFDLNEDEYEDYEKHPENWEDVTNNSMEDGRNMMYPDQIVVPLRYHALQGFEHK